jgi:hypothetical protein
MKRFGIAAVIVGLAAMALTAVALAGVVDPSAIKTCQKDGWTTVTRLDGSRFANQGQCVAYVARGGTLVALRTSQLLCESFGATYTTGTYPILWQCRWTFPTDLGPQIDALIEACAVETEHRVSFSAIGTADGVVVATCGVAIF